jgi:hypothetical protein
MASTIESKARELVEKITGRYLPCSIPASFCDDLIKAVKDAQDDDDGLVVKYRQAAHEVHHRDGELEIDDDAVVSVSEEAGAYVQAWVWVTDADAGVSAEDFEET